MKAVFFSIILAAVIVALMVRVWWGIIDFLNEVTRQPGREYHK